MASTVDWDDEVSTEFQTESHSGGGSVTASPELWNSSAFVFLLPFKAALIVFGVLGTLNNALVLIGFWLSDRSKLTSTSIHIANHTILEQPPL